MAEIQKKNTKGLPERPQGKPPKFDAFANALGIMFPAGSDWNTWVLACTDEELVFMVNDRLEPEQRISANTFKDYKAGKLPATNEEYGYLQMFSTSYKRALIGMKVICLERLRDDTPGAWQKWAWILERKFEEFNQRTKSVDETPNVRRLVLRVSDKG